MKRRWEMKCATAMIACSIGMPTAALARQQAAPNNAAAVNAANAANAAKMQEMQQAQARAAEAQQAQARQMQEAQAEARRSQEQALKAQEENARRAQTEAVKAQQEEAKQMQERAAQMQKQQQQAAQEQARNAQMKAQQDAMQGQQKQAQKAAQAQMKAQQMQAEQAQRLAQQQAQQRAQETARGQEAARAPESARAPGADRQEAGREQERLSMTHASAFPAAAPGIRGGVPQIRPAQPRAIPNEHSVPIEKAMSMPVLEGTIAGPDKEHAQAVQQNLQTHLIAVPGKQAPANFAANRSTWINNYTNNYWTNVNNQRLLINRSNTYVNQTVPNDYPYWYQQDPGWQFSNGFVLGNSLRVGLDWLRWGWHPYYGPPPDGFVCADDFLPTPWIYFPAYGLWQQPGVYGWAPSGPPFDYTGPITVEVLEPRHVHVRDPYTNWERQQVVNVVYLYNAFFDEESEHWGYMNRHGYFVWLNI